MANPEQPGRAIDIDLDDLTDRQIKKYFVGLDAKIAAVSSVATTKVALANVSKGMKVIVRKLRKTE